MRMRNSQKYGLFSLFTSVSFSVLLLFGLGGCSAAPSESADLALDPAVVQEKGAMITAKASNEIGGNIVSYYINGKKVATGVIHSFDTPTKIKGKFGKHTFEGIDTWSTDGYGNVSNVSQVFIDGKKAAPDLHF